MYILDQNCYILSEAIASTATNMALNNAKKINTFRITICFRNVFIIVFDVDVQYYLVLSVCLYEVHLGL